MTMFPGPVSNANTSSSLRARGNHRDVRDPADIQRDAPDPLVPIEQIIDKRHERRALPARGHVGGTKIAHRGDARARRNHRRLADLQRRGDALSVETRWHALMKNSLPVRADHSDLRGSHAKFLACGERSRRKYFAQQKIELADFAGGHRPAFAEFQDGFLHSPRERETRQSLRGTLFARSCAPAPRQSRPPTFRT